VLRARGYQPITDAAYDSLREVVHALHLDPSTP
jgi:hypothetical protein